MSLLVLLTDSDFCHKNAVYSASFATPDTMYIVTFFCTIFCLFVRLLVVRFCIIHGSNIVDGSIWENSEYMLYTK